MVTSLCLGVLWLGMAQLAETRRWALTEEEVAFVSAYLYTGLSC